MEDENRMQQAETIEGKRQEKLHKTPFDKFFCFFIRRIQKKQH